MSKKIFRFIMIAAFVAFAGFSAITVVSLRQSINSTAIASSSQTPESWANFPASADVKTNLDVVTDDSVALFTTSVKNAKEDSSLYVTHLASYLDEAHGNHDGFLPLSGENAEYTYTPNDSSSWQALSISAPKNGITGFRLTNALALGPAGSNTDTIYIRFQVSPSADDDVISDKVAFLLDYNYGYRSSATASTSVAIHVVEADPYIVAADTTDNNPHAIFDELLGDNSSNASDTSTVATKEDEDGDSAFAQPLGVFSEVTELKTIATVANTDTEVDGSFMSTASIILVAILVVFAIALIGYIIVVKI